MYEYLKNSIKLFIVQARYAYLTRIVFVEITCLYLDDWWWRKWRKMETIRRTFSSKQYRTDLLHHWQALHEGKLLIIHSLSSGIYRTENREHIQPFLYQKVTFHLTCRSRRKRNLRTFILWQEQKSERRHAILLDHSNH